MLDLFFAYIITGLLVYLAIYFLHTHDHKPRWINLDKNPVWVIWAWPVFITISLYFLITECYGCIKNHE